MIWILIATLDLWFWFAITVMVANGATSRSELNSFQRAFVNFFLVRDAIYNYTAGTILFWEFADNDRKTLTARVTHILHSGLYYEDEWRFKLALFICKYMIEPIHFGHCALSRLR